MLLSPRMQMLLMYMRENKGKCTFKSQCVYKNASEFYDEISRLMKADPKLMQKKPQLDRTMLYELRLRGMVLGGILSEINKETKQ